MGEGKKLIGEEDTDFGGSATETLSGASDWVGDQLNGAAGSISNTLAKLDDTVHKIADDPLPTIVTLVGSAYGIPPFITSAAITAARGGDLEDIAKSAAISYATANIVKGTAVNDITATIGEKVGVATTEVLGNAVSQGLNTAVVGAVRAGLTGKDIGKAIQSGFTSGAISSGSQDFVSSLNKDNSWGLSKEQQEFLRKEKPLIAGTVSTGLEALVTGKDPQALISNYIVNSLVRSGKSALAKEVKAAYNNATSLSSNLETLKKDQDALLKSWDIERNNFESQKTAFDKARQEYEDDYNARLKPVADKGQVYIDDYNKNKKLFDEQMLIYNDAKKSIADRNAANVEAKKYSDAATTAAENANKHQADNKALYDEFNNKSTALNSSSANLQSIAAALNDPTLGRPKNASDPGSLAYRLDTIADKFQSTVDQQKAAVDLAVAKDKEYAKQVSETAGQDMTLDIIKTGAISPIFNPEGKEGFLYFDNGISLGPDNQLYQNDKPIYSTAVAPEAQDVSEAKQAYETLGFTRRDPTQSDVAMLENMASGKAPQDLGYDYNQDGKVDSLDVVLVKSVLQGAYIPDASDYTAPWATGADISGWTFKDGVWSDAAGNRFDAAGNALDVKSAQSGKEQGPWNDSAKRMESYFNPYTGLYEVEVFGDRWIDEYENEFDEAGNFIENKAQPQTAPAPVTTKWGATGQRAEPAKAVQAAKAAATQKRQTIVRNTPEAINTGLEGLAGQLQNISMQRKEEEPPNVVQEAPELNLSQPFDVNYFAGMQQDQKLAQNDDGTVKIASGGYMDDLLELLYKRS
jgi:hypothetical protein